MNKSLPLSLALAALAAQALAEPDPGYVPPPAAPAPGGYGASAAPFPGYAPPPAAPAPGGYGASAAPTRFETVPEGEAGQIAEIISLTTQLLQDRYPGSMARRGVHPKDHGCVQAKFTVNPDIPDAYRVGVLAAPGKSYDAWVRFSNATGRITPDAPGGAATSRGMAVKLMGVEGATLLGEPGPATQDFLLINQPMFAFANVAQYLDVTRLQLRHHDDNAKIFPELFAAGTPEAVATMKIVGAIARTPLGNLLDAAYFSASPFTFGKDRVAKFAARPREHEPTPMPAAPAPDNYLREALKKSLDEKDGRPAVFDFQVQLRTSDSLPVENASAHWDEGAAPFQNVATLTIPKQDFDNAPRATECEHLVFTPWHGLAEFQPIGGINRLRLGVYAASSKYRAQVREPSGFPEAK